MERQPGGLQSTSPEFPNPVGRRKGVPGGGSVGKAVGSRELPSPQILNGVFSSIQCTHCLYNYDRMERDQRSGEKRGEREIKRRESLVVTNTGSGIRQTGHRPGITEKRATLASSIQWGS